MTVVAPIGVSTTVPHPGRWTLPQTSLMLGGLPTVQRPRVGDVVTGPFLRHGPGVVTASQGDGAP